METWERINVEVGILFAWGAQWDLPPCLREHISKFYGSQRGIISSPEAEEMARICGGKWRNGWLLSEVQSHESQVCELTLLPSGKTLSRASLPREKEKLSHGYLLISSPTESSMVHCMPCTILDMQGRPVSFVQQYLCAVILFLVSL